MKSTCRRGSGIVALVGALGFARAALAQPLAPLPPPPEAPPPQPYYGPAPYGGPVYGQPPPQVAPNFYYGAPPPPIVYVVPEPPVHAPSIALWVGGRLGIVGFGGNFFQNENGQGETTGNFVKSGLAGEIDIGARLGRHYVPYLFYEHGVLGPGHRFDGESASAWEDFYGVGFRYTAGDVDSVGFLSDLAIGFRSVSVSANGQTYTMSTFEIFRLGLGAEIRLSNRFVLSPMATVSGGTMSDTKGTVTYGPNGSGDGLTMPTYTNGHQIDSTGARGYVVVGIGCGAHFDLFGK